MLKLPFASPPSMALAPVDMASAAQNTIWARVRDINDFLVLFFYLRAGAAGENVTLNLQQATDNAGTNAKALNVEWLFFKRGSTSFTAANAATRDKFVQSTAASRESPQSTWNTTTDRVAATNDFCGMVLISPKDLDADGGFRYVRGQFTDPGTTAQLGCAFWIPSNYAYEGATAPSLLE